MKTKQNEPTANICVSKSRIKLYEKSGQMPTYYLQKGQEFQIELFNPTTDTVLAKITLNNKVISQGGLVLRAGQRVFLERFLDVEKKFLFDTYEVEDTAEVKSAIKNNGDFKVQFYKESVKNPVMYMRGHILGGSFGGPDYRHINGITTGAYNNLANYSNANNGSCTITSSNAAPYTLTSANVGNASFYSSSLTSMDNTLSLSDTSEKISKGPTTGILTKSKSIETGTVEKGSDSDQKFTSVDKDFDHYPFHTVENKILPISQMLISSEDINIKKYCTNCGAKLGKTDKFCSNCGTKA